MTGVGGEKRIRLTVDPAGELSQRADSGAARSCGGVMQLALGLCSVVWGVNNAAVADLVCVINFT